MLLPHVCAGIRLASSPSPLDKSVFVLAVMLLSPFLSPLLIWTPNSYASKRFWQGLCTNWIFLPLSLSIYNSLSCPTSKLNFWPFRQKAQIKQLVCDSVWSSDSADPTGGVKLWKQHKPGWWRSLADRVVSAEMNSQSRATKRFSLWKESGRKVNITVKASRVQTALPIRLVCAPLITAISSFDFLEHFFYLSECL